MKAFLLSALYCAALVGSAQAGDEMTSGVNERRVSTNVLDYGADSSGAKNSAAAFQKAMAATKDGGTIIVPVGKYRLDSAPWGTAFPNFTFQQAPGVTYEGEGASILPYGEWSVGHVYSNGFLGVSGPSFFCDGRRQVALIPGADESICSNYEILAPRFGVSHQLLAYMGADNNGNISTSSKMGNWVETLNIANNAHKLDLQPSGTAGHVGASYVGLEIDMQADSSKRATASAADGVYDDHSGAIAASDVMDTGLLITGGGWPPDEQPELIGTALNVGRSQGAWFTGLNVWDSRDGLVTNAYRYPIRIDTVYWGGGADPYCPTTAPPRWNKASNPNPHGCSILNGIYFDNVGGGGSNGSILQAGQLFNGKQTVFLTRATDEAPSGQFLEFRTHSAQQSLFSVDVRGNVNAHGSVTIGEALTLPGYSVDKLPREVVAGEIVMVTDAKKPSWGQKLEGGGETRCIALYNGSDWVVQ